MEWAHSSMVERRASNPDRLRVRPPLRTAIGSIYGVRNPVASAWDVLSQLGHVAIWIVASVWNAVFKRDKIDLADESFDD